MMSKQKGVHTCRYPPSGPWLGPLPSRANTHTEGDTGDWHMPRDIHVQHDMLRTCAT